MAKQKPSQQPSRNKNSSLLDKIDRGIEALQQRMAQVEDLQQDGFPYRDALRARVELQIRETVRQVFGEQSPEFQRYKNHRLHTTSEVDRAQAMRTLQTLVTALQEQRHELSELTAATDATSAGRPVETPPAQPPRHTAPEPPRVFPKAPPTLTDPPSPFHPPAPSVFPPSASQRPPVAQTSKPGADPIADILARLRKMSERFHLVSRQLRLRGEYRPTVEIEDQHDVEDLFDALLQLEFEDISKEHWVPSYMEDVTQTTLFLQQGQVAIVLKKTRPGRGPREIAHEVTVDAQRYMGSSTCTVLFCFIYDPEGRIGDPQGLEAELRGRGGSLLLDLVIAPK